jgi:hypothetical protein
MTQENLALEEFFFFFSKSHRHEYAGHVLIEKEQSQYKKKNNNNLTKKATTKPLPQETQDPQTSIATANRRHSSRHRVRDVNWKGE